MFSHKPEVAERPAVVTAELIALSIVALDLGVPDEGWLLFLGRRGIAIVPDFLGRDSIGCDAARRLFDERRADVLRKAALQAEQERAAVEADQQWRATLGTGVSAAALGGMSYAEALHEAELNSQVYRPRASVAADLLDNGGRGMVFHPLSPTEE